MADKHRMVASAILTLCILLPCVISLRYGQRSGTLYFPRSNHEEYLGTGMKVVTVEETATDMSLLSRARRSLGLGPADNITSTVGYMHYVCSVIDMII